MIMFRTASLLFAVHTVSLLFLPLSSCSETSGATSECTPSCGNIKIRSPFRLQGDPGECGNKSYEIYCEANGTSQSHHAVLYLFSGKYYVQAINYNNYTIRLVDAGVHRTKDNYFSNPVYPLTDFNFSYFDPYRSSISYFEKSLNIYETAIVGYITVPLIFLSCTTQMNYSDLFVETAPCIKNTGIHSSSDSSLSTVYSYFMLGRLDDYGDLEYLSPADWGLSSKITLMALVSPPPTPTDKYSKSCQGIYEQLAYGFELSWLYHECREKCRSDATCRVNGFVCSRAFPEMIGKLLPNLKFDNQLFRHGLWFKRGL